MIGGKNPDQDTTTELNYTMLLGGFIGFTNSTAVGSSAPAANVLFASQYAPIAGASAEPFIATEEGVKFTDSPVVNLLMQTMG